MTNNFSIIQVEVPKVTFSRQRQDEYREVSKSNKRNISRQILLLPQDLDFGWVAKWQQQELETFSHGSWDSFLAKTVLQCESWCCVLIATRSRSSSLPCCESEGTCIRHEWCPSRWWNVLDKALCSYGMFPTRAHWCCDVLYSTQTCSQTGTKSALQRNMAQVTSHSNRVCDQREMQHLRECWIPLKEAQLQANPWQES